jgi:phosphonate transport system permease protein
MHTVDVHRDPAWRGRVFWSLAALVLLAPALVAVEFKPWLLFEPDNLRITLRFLADFLPPAHSPDFLAMVPAPPWCWRYCWPCR